MRTRRTHYVTTTDGVTIGASVHGQGPPLVLLQGAIGDGDLDWGRLTEHLTGRFTCHLPSLRGRGLSGDHPGGVGPRRHVDDVLDYVDSIGEPTALAGWSFGAGLALAAAAQSDAVEAVAPFEPVMRSVMDEREQAALGAAVARMGTCVEDGRFAAAARAFAGWPFADEELVVAEHGGYFEAAGRYAPSLLDLLGHLRGSEDHTADDVLGAISAQVAVLHGSDTKPFFIAGARHVADHVTDARIHEIPGAGHAAPLTHPEALAGTLTRFFLRAQQPA